MLFIQKWFSDATAPPSQASIIREYCSQDDLSHNHFLLSVCTPVGDIHQKFGRAWHQTDQEGQYLTQNDQPFLAKGRFLGQKFRCIPKETSEIF